MSEIRLKLYKVVEITKLFPIFKERDKMQFNTHSDRLMSLTMTYVLFWSLHIHTRVCDVHGLMWQELPFELKVIEMSYSTCLYIN